MYRGSHQVLSLFPHSFCRAFCATSCACSAAAGRRYIKQVSDHVNDHLPEWMKFNGEYRMRVEGIGGSGFRPTPTMRTR